MEKNCTTCKYRKIKSVKCDRCCISIDSNPPIYKYCNWEEEDLSTNSILINNGIIEYSTHINNPEEIYIRYKGLEIKLSDLLDKVIPLLKVTDEQEVCRECSNRG